MKIYTNEDGTIVIEGAGEEEPLRSLDLSGLNEGLRVTNIHTVPEC